MKGKIIKDFQMKESMNMSNTTLAPVRIARIINLGSHHIEFLEDGSVDIVNDPARPDEYTHLTPDEAYKLFAALYEQYKAQ
jgi:hypothetical protein